MSEGIAAVRLPIEGIGSVILTLDQIATFLNKSKEEVESDLRAGNSNIGLELKSSEEFNRQVEDGTLPTVSCARVKDCIFSIEAKIESIREFDSRANPGTKSGTLEVVEATRFWAREDAINQERNVIDLSILRPISRLGDISYGRMLQAFQIPRPEFEKDLNSIQRFEELEKRLGVTDIQ
ncbi:hypothetical protein V8C40DRAFT_266759 [Trichoderma camerunense]